MENTIAYLRQANGERFTFACTDDAAHNTLLMETVEVFGPRYAPNGLILYLKDTQQPIIHEHEQCALLDIPPLPDILLPDLLIYHEKKQALFFVKGINPREAITVDYKSNIEKLFICHPLQRVYISVFNDREDYKKNVCQIAWGSYIWLSQAPEHTIFHW